MRHSGCVRWLRRLLGSTARYGVARFLPLRSIAHPLLLVSLAVGAGFLHGRPLPPRDSPAPSEVRVAQVFGRLPLYFIENHGQADARVAYYVQGRETSLYF